MIFDNIEAVSIVVSYFASLVPNTDTPPLERVLCIHYLVQFWKNQTEVQVLIDSKNEVNAMTLAYISKLGLKIWATNIKAQKIDGFTLSIFEIVCASFQVKNKLKKDYFFQATFLVVNTSIEIILGMPFLSLSNTNMKFTEKKFI